MDLDDLLPDARPVGEAVLGALEDRIGARLPVAVRRALARTGGGIPIPHRCTAPGIGEAVGIQRVLEPDGDAPTDRGVAGTAAAMAGRLPDGVLPIADAEGGNLLVVALAHGPAPEGAIGFWDHEREGEGPAPDPEAITWLAEDLDAFLRTLEPLPARPAPAGEGTGGPAAVVVSVNAEKLARWRAAEGQQP